MIALKLFAFVLFAYGITNMVVYAHGPFGMFEKWRSLTHKISDGFGELFTCMICLSTWVGALFSLINTYGVPAIPFTPFNIVFGTGTDHVILKTLMDLGLTSGLVWLIHNFEEAMERHCTFVNSEEEEGDGDD